MKARLMLVLLSVIVVSGCTSTGPTDTEVYSDTLQQGEITTYTVDTGNSSAQQVKSVLGARLSNAEIAHSIEGMEQNSTESGQLELQVEKVKNSSAQHQRIKELLEPGKFEAILKFSASEAGELIYETESGNKTFNIEQNPDSYVFDGETYQEGEEFNFRGRKAYFEDGELNIVAYTGDDIVGGGDERMRAQRTSGFQMMARITLSEDAAQHFHNLLDNYRVPDESRYSSGLERSDGETAKLYQKMDGESFQSLTITESLKETRTRTVSITLTAETEEKVRNKMDKIRAKITSGKLPEDVEMEKVD